MRLQPFGMCALMLWAGVWSILVKTFRAYFAVIGQNATHATRDLSILIEGVSFIPHTLM